MRVSGFAFLAGGTLTLIANAVLTPLMLRLPAPQMAASDIFLIRLSLAAGGVLALLIGLAGLREAHAARAGRLGMGAYWLAFIGTALLFAHEWTQVFFVHPLARIDAEALHALEYAPGVNLLTIEAIAVMASFMLGWLALGASLLAARTVARLGPALVVAGLFAVPLLAAATHAIAGEAHAYWGAVAGNLTLSAGWLVMGWRLMAPARA